MQDALKPWIDVTFFAKLVTFSQEYPNSLTRLWTTPARNKLVGGAPSSGHLADETHTCHAADLVFDTPAQLKAGARGAIEAGFQGIEVDLTNNHLHLDDKPRIWRVVHRGPKQETPLADWLGVEV
jgi:hypothetical protein